MYAYCNNNPVVGVDPTGKWTFSFNLGFFIGIGGGYSFNIGFSVDSNEMVAIQYSYSVPKNDETRNTVIDATAGLGVGMQYTNCSSVEKLNVQSKLKGVNVHVGSFDVVKSRWKENTFAIGAGYGIITVSSVSISVQRRSHYECYCREIPSHRRTVCRRSF